MLDHVMAFSIFKKSPSFIMRVHHEIFFLDTSILVQIHVRLPSETLIFNRKNDPYHIFLRKTRK